MKLRVMITMVFAGTFLFTGVLYAANGDLIVNGNSTVQGTATMNGNAIVNGNLGVGTSSPGQRVSVSGTIESTSGGFKFPDGTVQDTAAGGAAFPAGVIAMYGGSSAPAGWLLADGSAVSRTTYSGLFAAIGTTFGAGDGSTTFNVPDMRGRIAVGAGTGTGGGNSGSGLPAGGSALTARSPGNWFGEEKHTLTILEMPSHTHSTTIPSGQHYGAWYTVGYAPSSAGSSTGSVGGLNGVTQAHNTMQPSLVVNYIIKF